MVNSPLQKSSVLDSRMYCTKCLKINVLHFSCPKHIYVFHRKYLSYKILRIKPSRKGIPQRAKLETIKQEEVKGIQTDELPIKRMSFRVPQRITSPAHTNSKALNNA